MTAGSLMAAELAEQPQVLGRLVDRHVADRDQVRAVLPAGGCLAGSPGRCCWPAGRRTTSPSTAGT